MNWYLIIGLVLSLVIVPYLISIVYVKKEYDRWSLPHTWFVNVIRGLNVLWKSLFGVAIPKKELAYPGDTEFMTVTKDMAREAMDHAQTMMILEGIVYPEQYIPRAFDCENFAFAVKHYVDLFIAREYGVKGKGIPSQVIGYMRDKGGGHAVFRLKVEGKWSYHDPYPKGIAFQGFDPSPTELASMVPVTQ